MHVDLNYTYESDDLRDMAMSFHVAAHGNPPKGWHWEARTGRYGECSVVIEAVEDAVTTTINTQSENAK